MTAVEFFFTALGLVALITSGYFFGYWRGRLVEQRRYTTIAEKHHG